MAIHTENTRSELQSEPGALYSVDTLDIIVEAGMRGPGKLDAKPQEHEHKSTFGAMEDANAYFAQRDKLEQQEGVLNFDNHRKTQASEREQEAELIVRKLRAKDK